MDEVEVGCNRVECLQKMDFNPQDLSELFLDTYTLFPTYVFWFVAWQTKDLTIHMYLSLPQKIQEEIPSDPYEAEMVLLARASKESLQQTSTEDSKHQEPEKAPDNSLNIQAKVEMGEVDHVDNCNECK